MIDRKKKYKVHNDAPHIHVGQQLKAYFVAHSCNMAALARKLGINKSGCVDYVKRESLQVGILWKMSLALNHNFLADIALQLPLPFETPAEQALKEEVEAQKQRILQLETELAVYERINKG